MKWLLILLLASTLHAGDCVPCTFDTLSKLANKPIAYKTWYDEIMPNNKTADWGIGRDTWNKHFLLNPLICIYSIFPSQTCKVDLMQYYIPHLWIGQIPIKITDTSTTSDDCHCAIAYCTPHEMILVHTLSPEKFYFEHLTKEEFIKRTFIVYKVGGLDIAWQKMPQESK